MESSDKKREMVGVVLSDKMNKTRSVIVEGVKKHEVYGKILKTRKKYFAHDEDNKSVAGDRVLLQETIPLSKQKRWKIVSILN